jgi:hypothetical protein
MGLILIATERPGNETTERLKELGQETLIVSTY